MTWTLALAVTPSGIGAAKIGANDIPEITGYFPEVDRVRSYSSEGESARLPEKTVMVVEAGILPQQLRWFFGELVVTGIPASTVQVRSDVEVLTTAFGGEILLIDADRDVMVPPPGTGGEPIHAGRAEEIVQDTEAKVVLVGHPDVRSKVMGAIGHLDPIELDRSDMARIALENPIEGSLIDIPSQEPPAEEVSGEAPETNTRNLRVVTYLAILVVAIAVVAIALLL